MDVSGKKIAVIIPAYNEERTIRRVVEEVKVALPSAAIYVINDGSTDRTSEEAKASGAKVISSPYNLGIGGAVQIGFKLARMQNADLALQFDGDGQHDPASIQPVIQPVLSGQYDLCIGSRFLFSDSAFRSTFLRRVGIGFFSYLLRGMSGLKLTDPTSGFRAVNRKMIEIFSEHYPIDFPEPEAIKMAQRYGAKIGEVPVHMRRRLGGKSSIRFLAVFYYMVKVTFAILIDALRKQK